MGQQPGPSPEELEFIFGCFTRGLSDREVLEEMQGTEFPVRTPRFVRDRRREFNAARAVLEITLKQQIDPSVAKAKEDHLAEIRGLIELWVEVLPEWVPLPDKNESRIYTYNSLPTEINKLKDTFLYKCLREHLIHTTLLPKYDAWEDMYPKYIECCHKLHHEIYQHKQAWLERVKCLDFELPLLAQISTELTKQGLEIWFESSGGNLICEYCPSELPEQAIMVQVEKTTVLQAGNPEHFISEYQELGSLCVFR